MAQPVDWLGRFIKDEVKSVIEWKKHIQSNPHVKRDPDERFSDDGSNFRSVVTSSTLPDDAKVQITKVLSTDDPVTILISDGFTRVKARLSAAAIAILEAEFEESIIMEMRGDVFCIREATVISTPYGPSDGFIQLAINRIDYLYHLRRDVGQPRPIELKLPMVQLIKAITELRRQQYTSIDEEFAADRNHAESVLDASRENGVDQDGDGDMSVSQASPIPRSSPPVTVEQPPNTQLALGTQVYVRKEIRGSNLAKDGFEMEAGLNLDRPTGAGFAHTSHRVPARERDRPPMAAGKTAHLLGLFGKAEQPARPPSPAPLEERSPATAAHIPRNTPQSRRPDPMLKDGSAKPSSNARPTSPRPRPINVAPRDYSHRKIPRDQLKLLDQATSWFPALPGRQFPHPNVPIELLQKWNALIPTGDQAKTPAESQAPEPMSVTVEADSAHEAPAVEISDDSSSESSSEEEDIPASQWPPSPSQAQIKPSLPPDSSFPDSGKPSQRQKLPLARPNSVFGRYGRPSSLPKKPHSSFDGARDNTPKSSPPRRQAALPPDTSDEELFRSSPGQKRRRNMPSDNSLESPAAQSRSQQSQQHTLHNGTSGSVVKATQLTRDTDAEMEMDMDVPRSLPPDPALAHRQRRSEHFRAVQRRQWIKENYAPSSKPPPSFSKTFRAYRSAYPNDAIKLSDFADTIKQVYPDDDNTNNGNATPPPRSVEASQSPKAAENVASTSSRDRTSTADAANVVEAPAAIPSQPGQQRESLKPSSAFETPQPPGSRRSSNGSCGGSASRRRNRPVSVSSLPPNSTPRLSTTALHVTTTTTTQATPASSQRKLPWPTKTLSPQSNTPRPIKASTKGAATNNDTNTTTSTAAKTHKPPPASAPLARPKDIQVPQKRTNEASSMAAARKRPCNGVFAEFAQAYKRIRPGGAFAAEMDKDGCGAEGEKKHTPRSNQLEILAWEL